MWKDVLNKFLSRFTALARAPEHQWLVGAAGIGLGALLVCRVLYLPLVATIGDRYARLRELRVKLADARVLTKQQPSQEQALARMTARYKIVERQVGEGQSVARILETLSQQAKHHRLELVAVQPPAEEDGPRRLGLGPEMALRETPLTVQLTGRYRHVGEFLGELFHAPFLSSVRQLSMTKPHAERPALQADLALLVYLAEGAR